MGTANALLLLSLLLLLLSFLLRSLLGLEAVGLAFLSKVPRFPHGTKSGTEGQSEERDDGDATCTKNGDESENAARVGRQEQSAQAHARRRNPEAQWHRSAGWA